MITAYNSESLHKRILKLKKMLGMANIKIPADAATGDILKQVEAGIKRRVDEINSANQYSSFSSMTIIALECVIGINDSLCFWADIEDIYVAAADYLEQKFEKENVFPCVVQETDFREYVMYIYFVPVLEGRLSATRLRNIEGSSFRKIEEGLYSSLHELFDADVNTGDESVGNTPELGAVRCDTDVMTSEHEILPVADNLLDNLVTPASLEAVSAHEEAGSYVIPSTELNETDDLGETAKDSAASSMQSFDDMPDAFLLEYLKETGQEYRIEGEETPVSNASGTRGKDSFDSAMSAYMAEIADLEEKAEAAREGLKETISQENAKIERYESDIQSKKEAIKELIESEQKKKRTEIIIQYVLQKIDSDMGYSERLFDEAVNTLINESDAGGFRLNDVTNVLPQLGAAEKRNGNVGLIGRLVKIFK